MYVVEEEVYRPFPKCRPLRRPRHLRVLGLELQFRTCLRREIVLTLRWLLNLHDHRDHKMTTHFSFLTPLVWPTDNFYKSTNSSNDLVLSNAPSSLV